MYLFGPTHNKTKHQTKWFISPRINQSLTHSLTHSLTQSQTQVPNQKNQRLLPTQSPTNPVTHSLAHSATHAATHSLTHSLAMIHCQKDWLISCHPWCMPRDSFSHTAFHVRCNYANHNWIEIAMRICCFSLFHSCSVSYLSFVPPCETFWTIRHPARPF